MAASMKDRAEPGTPAFIDQLRRDWKEADRRDALAEAVIFGRAIISRNGLEAWMLFPERARAEHSC